MVMRLIVSIAVALSLSGCATTRSQSELPERLRPVEIRTMPAFLKDRNMGGWPGVVQVARQCQCGLEPEELFDPDKVEWRAIGERCGYVMYTPTRNLSGRPAQFRLREVMPKKVATYVGQHPNYQQVYAVPGPALEPTPGSYADCFMNESDLASCGTPPDDFVVDDFQAVLQPGCGEFPIPPGRTRDNVLKHLSDHAARNQHDVNEMLKKLGLKAP